MCHLCHAPINSLSEAEIHHIKPMASGGNPNDINNGMTLHSKCHTAHFEELHGYKLTATRAIFSKKGKNWWIYARNRKTED